MIVDFLGSIFPQIIEIIVTTLNGEIMAQNRLLGEYVCAYYNDDVWTKLTLFEDVISEFYFYKIIK